MPRKQALDLVVPYNLGLYYGKTPLTIPKRAVADGRNFRIRQGFISNDNLGWTPFSPALGTNRSTTKSLLHFNRADGSTDIVDSAEGQTGGPPYRAWTAAGNAQIDTAQSKFGGSSLLCDGTGDWVTTPDHTDFTLAAGSFSISMQVRPAADGTLIRAAGQAPAGLAAASTAWYCERQADNTFRFYVSNGSAFTTVTTTGTVLAGAFTQVRLVRMANTLYVFRGGVLEASAAFTGTVPNATTALRIGAAGEETGNPWNGWIDEFMLDVGATDYPIATFTPLTTQFQPLLNGPVMLIDTFQSRGDPATMVVATSKDLYALDSVTGIFRFITPQLNVGTVDVSAANPAVVTVNTGAPNWVTNGIKAGDEIIFLVNASSQTDDAWYTIASVDSNTQLTLTTAVTGAALTNVVYAIRRKFTGTIRDIWDTDTFVEPNDGTGKDMIFLTNGIEDIATWIFSDVFAKYQTTLGFKAKQLRVFKSMMVYGNLTVAGVTKPTTFKNSDIATPLNVTTGLAGEFKVHDGVDQIHEIEDLGDNLVIYSERHITLIQFVGDPLVFIFRQASTGIGPIGPRYVADFGDYHELLGADSQYLFDGVSVNEIGTQVWREILRQRDASRQTLGFNHFDEENGDLIWTIALTSDSGLGNLNKPPEEAFVEHYLEIPEEQISDPFSRRQMPFTAGGYAETSSVETWETLGGTWADQTAKWDDSVLSAAFPINLMGTEGGNIMIINVAQTANGVVMPSFVRSGRRPIADTRRRGTLKRVYTFAAQSPGNLTVTTHYSNHATGPIEFSHVDTLDLSLPDEGHFVTPYRQARFVEVEHGRSDGDPYRIEGYDIEAVQGGRR